MDIEQMKKYFKNKNNSEKLTKQVRDMIKTKDWQKQDMREGFTESFSPLIKSQESIKRSIDEQQNATIAQLKANQLALTDKENKLGELLTAMLSITDDQPTSVTPSIKSDKEELEEKSNKEELEELKKKYQKLDKNITTITPDFFDKGLNNKETLDVLERYGYENLPSVYFFEDKKKLYEYLGDVVSEINNLKNELKSSANIILKDGINVASPKNKSPRTTTLQNIQDFNTLSYYQYQLIKLYEYKNVQTGKGINNYKTPLQLLDRLELLAGSISAGNNGVINEFSEIAHLLAQMSVITKKDLNKLIKTYIPIR